MRNVLLMMFAVGQAAAQLRVLVENGAGFQRVDSRLWEAKLVQ
jgi:hypothetical protein